METGIDEGDKGGVTTAVVGEGRWGREGAGREEGVGWDGGGAVSDSSTAQQRCELIYT